MPLAPPMTGNGEFIPTIYGDEWGMVYELYTHINLIEPLEPLGGVLLYSHIFTCNFGYVL